MAACTGRQPSCAQISSAVPYWREDPPAPRCQTAEHARPYRPVSGRGAHARRPGHLLGRERLRLQQGPDKSGRLALLIVGPCDVEQEVGPALAEVVRKAGQVHAACALQRPSAVTQFHGDRDRVRRHHGGAEDGVRIGVLAAEHTRHGRPRRSTHPRRRLPRAARARRPPPGGGPREPLRPVPPPARGARVGPPHRAPRPPPPRNGRRSGARSPGATLPRRATSRRPPQQHVAPRDRRRRPPGRDRARGRAGRRRVRARGRGARQRQARPPHRGDGRDVRVDGLRRSAGAVAGDHRAAARR